MTETHDNQLAVIDGKRASELTVFDKDTGMTIFELASTLARCQYFKDVKDMNQAVVKLMIGRSLNVPPIVALTQIYVFDGKVQIGSTLLASKLKQHPRYDYRVKKHTMDECTITFFEDKQEIGESGYTLEEAKAAGLYPTKDVWKKYPRNMLFARAMSNGVKWYAPDVLEELPGLPIYTEGDEIEGEIVEEKPLPVADTQKRALERAGGLNRPTQDAEPAPDPKHTAQTPTADQLPSSGAFASKEQQREILRLLDEAGFTAINPDTNKKAMTDEGKAFLNNLQITDLKAIPLAKVEPTLMVLNLKVNQRKQAAEPETTDAQPAITDPFAEQ